MPRGLNADSASQVDVHVPIRVLHEGALRSGDVDGKGDLHAVRDELLFSRERGFRLGSRRDRDDLWSAEAPRGACCHGIMPGSRSGTPRATKGTEGRDYRLSMKYRVLK